MKQKCHVLLLVAAMITAAGCESDVDFGDKTFSSKVVLNSIINCTADTNVVKLSESVSLFSDREAKIVENPNLQLNVNGMGKAIIFNGYKEKDGYYDFVSSLNPGDKVEITGQTSEHGSFGGFDYVPSPPEIISVNTEWFIGKNDNLPYLRTLVKIRDNPSARNYYRIVIRDKIIFEINQDEDSGTWRQLDVYTDQEILFNNISGIGGEDKKAYTYRIFSDDLFQGKEYTLNVYVQKDKTSDWGNWGTNVIKDNLKVEIHALSENLYKYLRSLELAMVEDAFQEPTKVYSNVNEGYGIIGIYNVGEKVIELK